MLKLTTLTDGFVEKNFDQGQCGRAVTQEVTEENCSFSLNVSKLTILDFSQL